MTDLEYRYNPDWWNHSFCIEVSFGPSNLLDLHKSAWYFERRFDPEAFERAIEKFRDEYDFMNKNALIHYIQKHGNLRVRPGAVWNAPHYRGDVFDLPVVMDPFTKFPFGPLVERL